MVMVWPRPHHQYELKYIINSRLKEYGLAITIEPYYPTFIAEPGPYLNGKIIELT
jgi:hypothetical protein